MNPFIRQKNRFMSRVWRPFQQQIHQRIRGFQYRRERRKFTRQLRAHEHQSRPQSRNLKDIVAECEEWHGPLVFSHVSGRSIYFTAGEHEFGINFDTHCCVHHQTTGMKKPIPQPNRLTRKEMKRVHRLF